MVTHSVAVLKAVQAQVDLKYSACLGLSLGEYSALVAEMQLTLKMLYAWSKKR